MNNVSLIISVIIIAAAAILGVQVLYPLYQNYLVEGDVDQLGYVTGRVHAFNEKAGAANLDEFSTLIARGYIPVDSPYADGVGEARSGGDITAVTAGADTVTVTYTARSDEACLFMVDSAEQYVGLTGAPTCDANVLTAIVN